MKNCKKNLEAELASYIENLKREGLYREFIDIQRQQGDFPSARVRSQILDGSVTVWCSNDYLCQGQNPVVLDAMHKAIDVYGSGAGGTRNISGNSHAIVELEKTTADLHKKEGALVFTSGYIANESCLMALSKLLPNPIIFSDSLNHSSMISGIRRGGAKKVIFKHNDADELEGALKATPDDFSKLIAVESVYSMEGSIAPLERYVELAEEYNALIYLDEVHAVGLYGETGAGVAEQLGIMDKIDIINGTYGKAFGLSGGYIAGTSLLIDAVRSYSHGFIFTTAMSPVIAAGAVASIAFLKGRSDLREEFFAKSKRLKANLSEEGIIVMPGESHIVPCHIGDAHLTKEASDYLLRRKNIYIQPINYPTVPKGTERLRITPNPSHTERHQQQLIDALVSCWDDLSISPAKVEYS